MTWEELKEKAKKMGAVIHKHYICIINESFEIRIWENGEVYLENYRTIIKLKDSQAPDQMWQIMEALR